MLYVNQMEPVLQQFGCSLLFTQYDFPSVMKQQWSIYRQVSNIRGTLVVN